MHNKITIGQPKGMYDAQSAFMQELELYKAKSEIKPRKVRMMDSQVGNYLDELAEYKNKHIYIPVNGGFL